MVIAAIGILAAIVIVAINPQRQLAQIRDSQRQVDIRTYWSALEQYAIDNGSLPSDIASMSFGERRELCASGVDQATCAGAGLLYVQDSLVPTYLPDLIVDPTANGTESGYFITKGAGSMFLITNYSRETNENILQAGKTIHPPFQENILGWYGLESEMIFDEQGKVDTWSSINTDNDLTSIVATDNPTLIPGFGVVFNGWPVTPRSRLRVLLENLDSSDFSYAFVAVRSSPGIANAYVTWGLDTDLVRLDNNSNYRIEFGDTNTGYTLFNIIPYSLTGQRGIVSVMNGDTSVVRDDGVSVYSTSTATFPPPANNHFNVGFSNTATELVFSEIILFDRTLTENEMAEVESYLSNKWNVTLN